MADKRERKHERKHEYRIERGDRNSDRHYRKEVDDFLKNRMVKSEMWTKNIGPDDPLHPDFMKGAKKTAQAGLDRVKRELAAKRLEKKSQQKKKLRTGKAKPRGAYSRKHGERKFKDEN